MASVHHDPETSRRNHQRVRFIKGIYQTWRDLNSIVETYETRGEINHQIIDNLLENQLRILKDLSHLLYRMPESWELEQKRQRVLDRILGELWHELDKARDNVRLLESYHSGDGNEDQDKTIQALNRLNSQVIGAARRELPTLLKRARRMMEKLMPLFEAILHLYNDNAVVLRTIYFERESFAEILGPNALDHFFRLIHGSVGEGYRALIESLIDTKHIDHAEDALAQLKERAQHNSRLRPFVKRCADALAAAKESLPASLFDE